MNLIFIYYKGGVHPSPNYLICNYFRCMHQLILHCTLLESCELKDKIISRGSRTFFRKKCNIQAFGNLGSLLFITVLTQLQKYSIVSNCTRKEFHNRI
jgi:hypothetical protein